MYELLNKALFHSNKENYLFFYHVLSIISLDSYEFSENCYYIFSPLHIEYT